MERLHPLDRCPKCHFEKMAAWSELTEDERIVAERLPASADFTPEERKKHRFCTRCWFETWESQTESA